LIYGHVRQWAKKVRTALVKKKKKESLELNTRRLTDDDDDDDDDDAIDRIIIELAGADGVSVSSWIKMDSEGSGGVV